MFLANNPCYQETFFYSLTKNQYTYNIVPHFGSGFDIPGFDEKVSLIKIFPEFYDIVSTINITQQEDIVAVSKKAIATAAQPKIRYVAGITCPNKHDHPSYSNKGKGKHMDEDCCPDPDEWPNPMCAYSAKALGVMLPGSPAKKKG